MAPLWYRFRDDNTGLGENERWTFKGWQNQASFNNPTTQFYLYDLNEVYVVENMQMWTYWEKEDASQVATDSYCFDFEQETHNILGTYVTGLAANLKDSWYPFMGGKITIPTSYNGEDVKFVGGFKDATQITDIYFLDDSKIVEISNEGFGNAESNFESQLAAVHNVPSTLESIGTAAFRNCLKLQKCDLPNTLRKIGPYAFASMTTSANMTLQMNELPTNLEYLGEYSFCRTGSGIKFSVIPSKVAELPDWCLGQCPEITINQFGGVGSSLTKIGTNVFYNSGSPTVTTLTFEAPLATVDSYALFKSGLENNYGSSVTTINTHSLFGYETSDAWELDLFGWPAGDTRVHAITTNLTA